MDERSASTPAGWRRPTFDIGARVISPAFWALGVRRLDYMSVTHGDVDHIGGAASVFRDFRPFEVWEGVPVPPHAPTRELRALADDAGTVWRTLQPADRVSFGEVDLVVHHPPRPDWERQRVRNDDSEVLEIRYGGVSFVFTGDIGREVERTIAPSFARAPIRILKVPHHGSATSSSQTVSRRAAAGHRRHQRRTRESIRPPGAERAGAVPEHRGGDLPDRSGRGGDGGNRRRHCEGEDIHGTETDADDAWTVTRSTTSATRRHEEREGTKENSMIRVPSPLDDETEEIRVRDDGLRLRRAQGDRSRLRESIYRNASASNCSARNIPFECEKSFVVKYRDRPVGTHRLDLVVRDVSSWS